MVTCKGNLFACEKTLGGGGGECSQESNISARNFLHTAKKNEY